MIRGSWRIVVTSACIAFAVFVGTTFLHELAHAAVLLAQGADHVTISQGATAPHGLGRRSAGETVAVLAAGPLTTLVQGLVGLLLLRLTVRRSTAWRLAAFWIAYVGLAYVGVALAIATMGGSDVGRILGALDAPPGIAIILGPIGAAVLVLGVGPWCARAADAVLGTAALVALPASWIVIVAAQLGDLGELPVGPVAMMALPMVQLYRPAATRAATATPVGHAALAASIVLALLGILATDAVHHGVVVG